MSHEPVIEVLTRKTTNHKQSHVIQRELYSVGYHRMDAETETYLLQATDEIREKMEKYCVLNGSDFSKPWKSTDVVLLVDEQRFYVHRWVLAMWSPVFEKMFTSNFLEREKTEISLPYKRSDEFQEMLVMVYSNAERPVATDNCFILLKLSHEYQMETITRKCEDYLVGLSGSICAGQLSLQIIFPLLAAEPLKNEKEQVLSLLILAQEYRMEKLLAACLHEAREFSLKELKQGTLNCVIL